MTPRPDDRGELMRSQEDPGGVSFRPRAAAHGYHSDHVVLLITLQDGQSCPAPFRAIIELPKRVTS